MERLSAADRFIFVVLIVGIWVICAEGITQRWRATFLLVTCEALRNENAALRAMLATRNAASSVQAATSEA